MDSGHGGRACVSVSVDGKTEQRNPAAKEKEKEILGF
jgi:hypothetical protein